MKVNFQVRCEGLSNKAQRDSWVTYKKGLHKMEGKISSMGYVGFERKYFFFLCGDKNPIYEFGHKTTVYIPYIKHIQKIYLCSLSI